MLGYFVLGHGHFLPNTFYFIIQILSSYGLATDIVQYTTKDDIITPIETMSFIITIFWSFRNYLEINFTFNIYGKYVTANLQAFLLRL
jgi:hypothetical protein